MQPPELKKEHAWLQKLVGDWQIELERRLDMDQPLFKSTRRESVRSLGPYWIIAEGSDDVPESAVDSIVTLGFDPRVNRFVGSFITSIMAHFWPYSGVLDPKGQFLTLSSEGPSFSGDGSIEKYHDIIELVTDDYLIFSSQMLGENGEPTPIMEAHYRRLR